MNIPRRALFGKLNLDLFRAIESATAFAKLRGNPYVELVHWLHQIWQIPGNDLHRLASHHGLNDVQVERDLTVALAQLPSGAVGLNDFSHMVELAIERAWVFASLTMGDSCIRGAWLLGAMLQTPELRRLLLGISASFQRLPVALSGDELLAIVGGSGEARMASRLFEMLHVGAVASLTGVPDRMAQHPHVVTRDALVHEGLGTDQSLLPVAWNTWHGHNLLHEYFACPSRFYFFALQGLAPGLSRIQGKDAEVVVLLTQDTAPLRGLVDEGQLALFCTPVVNLFDKRTDRIEIHPGEAEFQLVPDRSRPMDFEVFSVQEMRGQKADTTQELVFRPMFQTLNQDEGNHGRYFSLRREGRLASDSARRYGTRTPYVGTEVFVSLVDQQEAPYPASLRYLSVQALLTNRDLPRLVPRNGHSDLSVTDSLPLSAVGLVRAPSQPRAPFAQGETAWRLIRQLNFNYLPLMDMDTRQGAQALRDMLRLFVGADDAIAARQVDGLIGSRIAPVTRRLPGNGPLVYGRGVQCDLTVDEDAFSGTSPYLFGLVLEHYLARHVSINVFTETRLESMQRGMVASWDARMGTRSAV